nr:hypothetical protein [Tanacetum cinerariifolium]
MRKSHQRLLIHHSMSSGQSTNPYDTEGNKQSAVKGFPFTKPKDGTRKSKLLPEGKTIDPKDSEGNIQPTDMGLLSTYDKMLMEDSDEELKELSDDDIFEAEEDMDDPFPLPNDEETQPPPSTKQT